MWTCLLLIPQKQQQPCHRYLCGYCQSSQLRVVATTLTLPKAAAALTVATDISVATTAKETNQAEAFQDLPHPLGVRCESGKGGYKIS